MPNSTILWERVQCKCIAKISRKGGYCGAVVGTYFKAGRMVFTSLDPLDQVVVTYMRQMDFFSLLYIVQWQQDSYHAVCLGVLWITYRS
jgi:hypothetical protein